MDQDPKAPDTGRRKFLRAARGAGALGALAAIAARDANAAEVPVAEPAAPEPSSKGYHETEHIRKYYSTARYW